MSDLRYDPITGHWAAIAENRQARPYEFQQIETRRPGVTCPFCAGSEEHTPAAALAYDNNGCEIDDDWRDRNWLVRVVPNKFPSFPDDGRPAAENHRRMAEHDGPYATSDAAGIQEVIIESPRHVASLSDLYEKELVTSFRAYQARLAALANIPGIAHAMLFKNCRPEAGASLEHVHTQLIGIPVVTEHLGDRVNRAKQYFHRHGRTMMSALLDWELAEKKRILQVTDRYVVFCPFASRFAYQVWIVPRQPQPFIECADACRDELAALCQYWTRQMEELLDNPAYNLLQYLAPFREAAGDHWFFELFPRLNRAAGFEWGTGCWVNPVSPETAASRLAGR